MGGIEWPKRGAGCTLLPGRRSSEGLPDLTVVCDPASELGTLWSVAFTELLLALTLSATRKHPHTLHFRSLWWPGDTVSSVRTDMNWIYVLCPSLWEYEEWQQPWRQREAVGRKKWEKSKRRKWRRGTQAWGRKEVKVRVRYEAIMGGISVILPNLLRVVFPPS